ncbi:hypothetical protein M3649_21180 [Ureibacillus chungkukjangi]|uniref:hypothetical protein n=1 Tax=Ureibacillus chungkukjangi TaxID=1202712 RepID=UPI00203CA44C|nr:hypothetical protein [Ureibacillus chungkukjangi]MCM3390600.1 hypothetical protein [Ureibacillus chungkukjangi]
MTDEKMITLGLNKEIFNFWENDYALSSKKENYHNYLPGFLTDLKERTLTIIGCNPSLNKNGYKNCFAGTPYENTDFLETISRAKNTNFADNFSSNVQNLHNIEKHIVNKHQYASTLRKFANDIGIQDFDNDVTLLDLFFIRDTNQKNIEKRVRNKDVLTTFATEQIKIMMTALNVTNPDIILIPNAFASNIFIKANSNKISIKQIGELRFFTLDLAKKQVPIFFSSMISGKRALDTFSLQRLTWDMTNTLSKIRNGDLDFNIIA